MLRSFHLNTFVTSVGSCVHLSISLEETISLPKGFTEILKNPSQQSTQGNKVPSLVIKQVLKVLLQY